MILVRSVRKRCPFIRTGRITGSHYEIVGNGKTLGQGRKMPGRVGTIADNDDASAPSFSMTPQKFRDDVVFSGTLVKDGSQVTKSGVTNWQNNFVGSAISIDLIKYNLKIGESAIRAKTGDEFIPVLRSYTMEVVKYVDEQNSKYAILDAGMFALGCLGPVLKFGTQSKIANQYCPVYKSNKFN